MISFASPTPGTGLVALRHRRRVCAALAFVLAGMVAQGCDTSPRIADDDHPMLTDPRKRHPIVVVADTPTLDLALADDPYMARPPVHLQAMRFMTKYKQEGKGPITVWVQSSPGNQRLIAARLKMLRSVAHQAGLHPEALRVRERPRAAEYRGAMTLSYDRVAAVGPACGDWSENTANNPDKLPYANFGCASQRNLAAMAARPTDFVFPAPEVERGGEKRSSAYKSFTNSSAGGAASGAPSAPATAPPAPISN